MRERETGQSSLRAVDVVTVNIYDDYMEVGVRELKAKLSQYVSRAAAGESVVVTDRGTPVARLVAFGEDASLERGIEEGWIEAPRRNSLGAATRYVATSSVQATLDEDRGS